jgi:predicted MFS family arabinose efflux permease
MTERPQEHLNAESTAVLVAWMWVAYFLNYCDRQAVFAMFKVLKTDLSMSDTELGLTGAFFLWVYGIGCPIAGYLADRYPKRHLILGSLIVWSLVTIATGLSVSAGMLLAMRAAMGISEALFMPAAISLTTNLTRVEWRSRAVASLTTAQIAGVIAGASFGGWMAQQGYWRAAFVLLGILGLLYAIPYASFLSQLPESNETRINQAVHPRTSEKIISAFRIFRSLTFCILCVAFPLFVFGLWMIYSWLARYLEETFRLSTAEAGWVSTAYLQGATVVGLFLGGYLADSLGKVFRSGRISILLASMACCAPLLRAIGQTSDLGLLKLVLIGYGFCSGWMIGNIFPAAFEVVRTDQRGLAVGILNLFGALLSGFAPLLVGKWKDTLGFPGMIQYAAMAYGFATLLLLIANLYTAPRDIDHHVETNSYR